MAKSYSPIKAALWRFARVAVAVIIAGVAVKYGNSPYYLAIAPLLAGLDKYLRDTI